jgi:hypothetical protein
LTVVLEYLSFAHNIYFKLYRVIYNPADSKESFTLRILNFLRIAANPAEVLLPNPERYTGVTASFAFKGSSVKNRVSKGLKNRQAGYNHLRGRPLRWMD